MKWYWQGKAEVLGGKPNAILSTTNPTRNGLGLNRGFHDESWRPAAWAISWAILLIYLSQTILMTKLNSIKTSPVVTFIPPARASYWWWLFSRFHILLCSFILSGCLNNNASDNTPRAPESGFGPQWKIFFRASRQGRTGRGESKGKAESVVGTLTAGSKCCQHDNTWYYRERQNYTQQSRATRLLQAAGPWEVVPASSPPPLDALSTAENCWGSSTEIRHSTPTLPTSW